jgi:hypothetical protein
MTFFFLCSDLPKVPIGPDSRTSTWADTPSRTSSIDPETDLAAELVGLTLGGADIFREYSPKPRDAYGQFAGPNSGATSPTLPRVRGSTSSTGGSRGRGSISRAPAGIDKVQSGRVTKGPSAPAPKKIEKDKPQIPLRLGCLMCKADPERYMGVVGPCTDLKGITPTAKALMEHLKKHHSRYFRCENCWKWHKSQEELDKHKNPRPNGNRCTKCCREFKTKADLDKHTSQRVSCEIDAMTKPELFTDEQELAFRGMKNRSSEHHSLNDKYQWCFKSLFPGLAQSIGEIWPCKNALSTFICRRLICFCDRLRLHGFYPQIGKYFFNT